MATSLSEAGTRLGLSILSYRVPAQELVAAIGLAPDQVRDRAHNRYGGLTYRSRLDRTAPPEDHLDDLLSRLRPHAPQIAAVATRLNGEPAFRPPFAPRHDLVSLRMTHYTPGDETELRFTLSQLTEIAALGAYLTVLTSCGCDFVDDGEVTDEAPTNDG